MAGSTQGQLVSIGSRSILRKHIKSRPRRPTFCTTYVGPYHHGGPPEWPFQAGCDRWQKRAPCSANRKPLTGDAIRQRPLPAVDLLRRLKVRAFIVISAGRWPEHVRLSDLKTRSLTGLCDHRPGLRPPASRSVTPSTSRCSLIKMPRKHGSRRTIPKALPLSMKFWNEPKTALAPCSVPGPPTERREGPHRFAPDRPPAAVSIPPSRNENIEESTFARFLEIFDFRLLQ